MDILIEFNPWDSNIFNKKIYDITYINDVDFSQLLKNEEKLKSENAYMAIVKINHNDLFLVHNLEKLGYNFTECLYEVRKDLFEIINQSPLCKLFELQTITKRDQKYMNEIINIAQNTFDKDRYHMDPQIPHELADQRYKNWVINSLEEKDVSIYAYISQKERNVASFLITKKQDKSINLILGGVLPKLKGYGVFYCMLIDCLNTFYKEGNTSVFTKISGSNFEIFNMYMFLNFKINKRTIVMRKIFI